jgi:hypothetical protein
MFLVRSKDDSGTYLLAFKEKYKLNYRRCEIYG